ncbi:DUF3152 domain-containing protein [Amycolatopsis sp. GA6-003]|uniref:DUF3152 domain-containing protein n=1 Tax=Amycolatopsis sp. GA6-003 TaxID=2652444 RepID=UPI0039175FC4
MSTEPVRPRRATVPPALRAQTVAWRPLCAVASALALSCSVLLIPTAPPPPPRAPGKAGPTAAAYRPPPPAPVDSAALPDGVPFAVSGAGTWHVVPGASGTTAGAGPKLLTYTVEVEDGIQPTADDASFAAAVDTILADPRSWTGLGKVSLRRLGDPGAEPDFRVSLTSPGTSRRPDLCGFAIPYDTSCNLTKRGRVVINLARWVRGAHSYDGDLPGYRRYAVNHEVGHALGHGHVGCPAAGAPAPVMMQQTFGLSNTYLAQLNRSDPGGASPVQADGKVCRAQAWVVAAS